MQIVCPKCSARFSFDETRVGDQGIKLRCSHCSVVFKVIRRPREAAEPLSTTHHLSGAPRIKVLVANESPAFCAAVAKVLFSEPFEVIAYNDGRETMTAIEVDKPAVVLLDVALPSMYGFEICEAVRRNPALDGVKLILVASIYDKTRYKRTPSSLYGADAYIEKHHIPDSLAALIHRLVGGEQAGKGTPDDTWDHRSSVQSVEEKPTLAELTEQEGTRKALVRDEERVISGSVVNAGWASGEESEAYAKARRLARIIVSDILLYNQAKVEEGVRNGSFFELLSAEIKEGRALFARRVAPEINVHPFLDEAFDMLIAGKRQEMNL